MFADDRLQRRCESQRELARTYGPVGGAKIDARVADLRAAPTLQEMHNLPGKCHELKADRKGQLAIHLDGARRLVLEPSVNPRPTKPDGGLDWANVTSVRIIEIIDYHD